MKRFKTFSEGFYTDMRKQIEPHVANLKSGEHLTTQHLAHHGITHHHVTSVLKGMVKSKKYGLSVRRVGRANHYVKD